MKKRNKGPRGPKPDMAKRKAAVALRELGKTYAEIGRALGVSRQRAHKLCEGVWHGYPDEERQAGMSGI